VGSQTEHPRSRLAMLPPPPNLSGLQSKYFGLLAVAKIRARQSERRCSLPRDSDERFCQSALVTARLRSLLRRATARQPATLFAATVWAEPRLAAELLSCTEGHTCRRAPADVRVSEGIRGSSPPAGPNPSAVHRDCDATSGQARTATVLETLRTLQAAEAPQAKVQCLSEENKVSHRANKSLNGCPSFHPLIARSGQPFPKRMLARASPSLPAGSWDQS